MWVAEVHPSLRLTELFRSGLLGQEVVHVGGGGPSTHVAGGAV